MFLVFFLLFYYNYYLYPKQVNNVFVSRSIRREMCRRIRIYTHWRGRSLVVYKIDKVCTNAIGTFVLSRPIKQKKKV